MAKWILCSGPVARHPYLMKRIGQRVWSLEELCYVLYQNIYVLMDEMFDQNLCRWLREEIDEKRLADRLETLISSEASLEQKVGVILSACDYYTENEQKNTIFLMQRMEHLSPIEKWKLKGDGYLEDGSYEKAAQEYEALLSSREGAELDPGERGKILHNLALTHLYTDTFLKAAEEFDQAAQLTGSAVSALAAQEARKLAAGELPDYARVGGQSIQPETYDAQIAAWKEELRRAYARQSG